MRRRPFRHYNDARRNKHVPNALHRGDGSAENAGPENDWNLRDWKMQDLENKRWN